MVGAPWFLIVPVRLRIASSPTWWSDSAPVRSRLVLLAAASDWPSTTSCFASRRSWALTPNTSEKASASLSKKKKMRFSKTHKKKNSLEEVYSTLGGGHSAHNMFFSMKFDFCH